MTLTIVVPIWATFRQVTAARSGQTPLRLTIAVVILVTSRTPDIHPIVSLPATLVGSSLGGILGATSASSPQEGGPAAVTAPASVRAGRLPDTAGPDVLLSRIVGPFLYRRLVSREPLTDELVEAVLEELRPPRRRASSGEDEG